LYVARFAFSVEAVPVVSLTSAIICQAKLLRILAVEDWIVRRVPEVVEGWIERRVAGAIEDWITHLEVAVAVAAV
jgi:hypothetical protein